MIWINASSAGISFEVGISFVGGAYGEATLIGMAYAYEQASMRRRAPAFPGSVNIKA